MMQTQALSRCASNTHVYKAQKAKRGVASMPNVRRSLTISEENDTRVQRSRSWFLSLTPPIDFDYTAMTNILLEIGSMAFQGNNWKNDQLVINGTKIVETVIKYSFDSSLQNEAMFDQFFDRLMKSLPQIIEKSMPKTQQPSQTK